MAESIRQAGTLKDIAKVILEEEKKGLYPVKFNLPNIYFSDEGEMAQLSPVVQAIVEENMSELKSNKGKKLYLTLKGLVKFVAEGDQNPQTGKEVLVALNSLGEILYVRFASNLDVNALSYPDLVKLGNILATKCYPRDNMWKCAKFMVLKRIKKLKGEA